MACADDIPAGQGTGPRGGHTAMGTAQCCNPITGDALGATGPKLGADEMMMLRRGGRQCRGHRYHRSREGGDGEGGGRNRGGVCGRLPWQVMPEVLTLWLQDERRWWCGLPGHR